MSNFLNNVNLNAFELRNAVMQNLATAPSSPTEARMYWDTVAHRLLLWNAASSAWELRATNSDLLNAQAGSYYLSRTNHTGTQTASTISDLATTVKAYTLDTFAAPIAPVSFNSQRLTNLADPTSTTSQEGATANWVTGQVQSAAAGIDGKPPVRAVAIANIVLSGTQTIDGVVLIAGDRVLTTAQTTNTQNGPYIVSASSWTRPTDNGATGELNTGAFWYVSEGTTYAKTQWRCSTTGAIVVGTTPITIYQFGGASDIYTGSTGILLTGNSFTGVVVASGGLTVGASGFAIDTSIVARKFSTSIGDGTSTSIVVTHNLGTQDVHIICRSVASTFDIVYPDIQSTSTTTCTIIFGVAPTTNQYRVTVIG